MFGCFRKLGCLVFLLVLAVAAWFYRDRLEAAYRRYAGDRAADSVTSDPSGWEPLSAERAARGQKAVESLSKPANPAYTNISAGEAASYIYMAAAQQMPDSARQLSSSIRGDRLYVRGYVALREFGDAAGLGPLAGIIGARDTVQLGGTMRVLRQGVGEFQIREAKVGSFPVPAAIIPRLVKSMRKGTMPEGIADDALPMTLPAHIGDIRIASGRITVYRAAP